MNAIEPHLAALAWFGAFWSICCLGFLQIAGMYPLARGSRGTLRALVVASSALWVALASGTCLFAWAELRPTTIIVAGGLLILFIPDAFQSLPRRWRDGGIVVTAAALSLGLAALLGVAGKPVVAWI